jgi:hypothetical protein
LECQRELQGVEVAAGDGVSYPEGEEDCLLRFGRHVPPPSPPGNITGGSGDGGFAEEAAIVRSRMPQHSIALTMAEICRRWSAGEVQLLAQDPAYMEQTMGILKESGFSFVGSYGAAGFAQVDEETLVFSACVGAPLKQIIADIARPQVVIPLALIPFTSRVCTVVRSNRQGSSFAPLTLETGDRI